MGIFKGKVQHFSPTRKQHCATQLVDESAKYRIAEKLFNVMLHDFRVDVLPCVAENWNEMTDQEREQLTPMNNFFCGLHFLVGLANAAEETVKLWDALLRKPPGP